MHELVDLHFTPNILAVIGLIIAASFLGSKLLQRIGIPQVVGFIAVGFVLLAVGLSEAFGVSLILTTMVLGTVGRAQPMVRSDLGLGLLSQAGVAS